MKDNIALNNIVNKTFKMLKEVPLCDRCLGRIYSTYGVGLSNKLRGISIKVLLTMLIPYMINKLSSEEIKRIAANIKFQPFCVTLQKLNIQLDIVEKPCYICGDTLDSIIEEYTKIILKECLNYEFDNFLVGVHIPSEIATKEEELMRIFKIESYESIKNEIKREIGKKIKERLKLQPEFQEPDIVFLVNLVENRLDIIVKPLFISGRYIKLGRKISQVEWLILEKEGYRLKYDLSVEKSLQPIAEIFNAQNVVLHAAGREDVDARMLGYGRPMIIELKNPKFRKLLKQRLLEAEKKVARESNGYVHVFLYGKASKNKVKEVKEQAKYHAKTYKVLVISDVKVSEEELKRIENVFSNKVVSQRTPTRVLHRRPDILREKKVYKVIAKRICENLFELLVKCEGGLYVKELVDGDFGRTYPSFSSTINKNLKCIELDVLNVSM